MMVAVNPITAREAIKRSGEYRKELRNRARDASAGRSCAVSAERLIIFALGCMGRGVSRRVILAGIQEKVSRGEVVDEAYLFDIEQRIGGAE